MRHWSLMRMLCWPLRFPFNASSWLPGGIFKLTSVVAACRDNSFLLATRSMLRKRGTTLLLNSASVWTQINEWIISNYVLRYGICQLYLSKGLGLNLKFNHQYWRAIHGIYAPKCLPIVGFGIFYRCLVLVCRSHITSTRWVPKLPAANPQSSFSPRAARVKSRRWIPSVAKIK